MSEMEEMDEQADVVLRKIGNFGVVAKMSKVVSENASYCPNDIPPASEYLSAINFYGIILLTCGALAVIVILIMFFDTLKYIMENSSPRVKTHSTFVIGVYPVVALATYCATFVPRAHLLAEAMTQGIFMAAMYQLFCLFVSYCGGEAELIRRVKPDSLNPRVGPCCCWPCCCCLPSVNINKNRVRYLRLLVLQLPVVQGLVYATLLVLWAERELHIDEFENWVSLNKKYLKLLMLQLPVVQGLVYAILLVLWAQRESLYQVNYMYFQPVIIISILIGVWGMSMTINLLRDVLKDYSMPAKFLVLQFVLLCAKMQALVTRIIVWFGLLPCKPPITPAVFGNLIHNTLMLAEMVLLGYIARRLYKKMLPTIDDPTSSFVITTIGTLMLQDRNNNKNNDRSSSTKTESQSVPEERF